MNQDIVSLENSRFNESIHVNSGGSIFLGYLYTELTVLDVLADDEELKIGMPDLQVRITRDGKPRVDFPQDELVQVDGKWIRADSINGSDAKEAGAPTKWVARYFSASKATREAITELAFAIPAVSRAVDKAERKRAAA